MADLTIDMITSLDGCASGEGWPGWWGLEGPEYLGWLEQVEAEHHTVLMGATTYRLMSSMAAADPPEPGLELLDAFGKVVFSNTLEEPLSWANTRLVRGDAVEAVRALKQEEPGALRTLGSLSLARSLLAAGLVDRFRVVVFPVITGRTGSERIYDGYPDVALDLVESRVFDGRTQLLEYVPTVIDGPPSRG